jgi:ribosomal protein S18 acetylase RimI-like enzyme
VQAILHVVEIVPFDRAHLVAVMQLCRDERWDALAADPERTARILTAPGVTTVVAVEENEVLGFAELFSDGELQAYLSAVAVVPSRRRSGLGSQLVRDALGRAGGERVDLLGADDAVGFYEEAFESRPMAGFRLHLRSHVHEQ